MEEIPAQSFQNSVDVKLDYIQRDLREMKGDIKDIKADFIPRREFNESVKEVKDVLSPLQASHVELQKDYNTNKTRLWTAVTVLTLLGGAIITLSVMAIDAKIKNAIDKSLSQYNVEIK